MTIYGIFPAEEAAEAAMEALKLRGFTDADIGVLYTRNVNSGPLADERRSDARPAAPIAAGNYFTRSLEELRLPDHLAQHYGRRLKEEDTVLLAVRAEDDFAGEVRSILEHAGAQDISETKAGMHRMFPK